MKDLASISTEELLAVNGGVMSHGIDIDPSAAWVMQHESGGSTTAGHLYAQGRGDGTPGNHSSAFGAFQMTQATRRQYMGANYQSTNFATQYSAATRYADQRYGSWAGAEKFWKAHRWY